MCSGVFLYDGGACIGSLDSLQGAFLHPLVLDQEEMADGGGADGRTTPRLAAPRKEQSGQSYRSTRFGFRHANAIRPTTSGPQPKVTDFDYCPATDRNNNNAQIKGNLA